MKGNIGGRSPNDFAPLGHKRWVICEGYLSETSEEILQVLNISNEEARLEITIFHSHHEPVGIYRVSAPPRRLTAIRISELKDPAPIPYDTPFGSVIDSNIPVVLQQSRFDSRNRSHVPAITMGFGDHDAIM